MIQHNKVITQTHLQYKIAKKFAFCPCGQFAIFKN